MFDSDQSSTTVADVYLGGDRSQLGFDLVEPVALA